MSPWDMAKRRPARDSTTGARWLWGTQGPRLFDPVGVEYEPSRDGLRRADVLRLVKSGEMPVATHDCGEGVAWLPPNEASAAWASVEADFEDVEAWRPLPGAPGTLPYRAELWRALRGHGQALVLRND